ncbi:DUF1499 domain-containing protein [Citromicrobium bathyomarinum]|uniref:DUF1499 domain-containing protein n=1 Tax=Citromicrobium bathyomarinum TaxID=72174 RepID=UPI003159B3FC
MTHKWTRALSWLALLLALGATIVAFTGMTLARVDRIGKLEGFGYLASSAPFAAAALVIGLIAIILNWRKGWPARRAALLGFLIALGFVGSLAVRVLMSSDAPMIHDATTDLADVPQFEAITLPDDNLRGLDNEAEWVALHEEGYPDLRSVVLDRPVAQTILDAEKLAEERGWTIRAVDPEEGRLEATAYASYIRFEDEVVIRVRPDGAGRSLVDMRSTSRVGIGDLGVNAQRIHDFLEDLAAVR